MQQEPYPRLTPDFGHWLAGLIDGEGCFMIDRRPSRTGTIYYLPRFILRLRDDDRPILEEVVVRTGLGILYAHRAQHPERHGGTTDWKVFSKANALGLVELLDRYPLRAKKAKDFAFWRQAVIYWGGIGRPKGLGVGRGSRPVDWGPLPVLREQLLAGRAYIATEAIPQPRVDDLRLFDVD